MQTRRARRRRRGARASTAPTCGCTTSPGSWRRRSRCWRRSAARTSRIEIGTGVIDMRYENPLYMAEEAAAADLISDGRLQLGVSRGSPETALRGSEAFGYVPAPTGSATPTWPASKTALFLAAIAGRDGRRRRSADDRGIGRPAGDPAAVAGPGRPDLVGLGHPRHRRVGGAAGDEPDELDAAGRGHRRAVRRAAGRADRPLPRRPGPRPAGSGSRGSRSAAASCRSSATWTASTSASDPGAGPGRHPRGRARPVRQELRG